METEKPATGILKQGEFGDAIYYTVQCDCTDPDHSHWVEVEADDYCVSVNIFSEFHSKWWQKKRWRQIWQLLTKGYIELQSTIILKEQAAHNYAEAIKSAIEDVKVFKARELEKRKSK